MSQEVTSLPHTPSQRYREEMSIFYPSDGPPLWAPRTPLLGVQSTQDYLGQIGEGWGNSPQRARPDPTASLAVVSPQNLAMFACRIMSNNKEGAKTPLHKPSLNSLDTWAIS